MSNPRDSILIREQEIIKLLTIIKNSNLQFIIVGGYAIATIMKRFSVDLDLIIKNEEKAKFEELLKNQGYSLAYSKEISTIYGENFMRYEKKIENLPVSVDLLINGLVSRTTSALWSFDNIQENSEIRNIESIPVPVPIKELLIAMKLHSGRISDTRDIVVLSENTNLTIILKHSLKGNVNILKEITKKSLEYLKSKNFKDGFQGVFGLTSYKPILIENSENIFKIIINAIPNKNI